MARVHGASARLRRAFRYPSGSGSGSGSDADSDSDQPQAMDEQEQEALIARLAAQNSARNQRFRSLLVGFPLLVALAYVPDLARPRSALVALVALSSLLSTAYLLVRLPPPVTGIAPLDAWSRRRPALASHATSPLETYLPYLNAGLAAVLVLMGLAKSRGPGGLGSVVMCNLPAAVYVLVLAAKMVMGSVDPERELSSLKYEYKGA